MLPFFVRLLVAGFRSSGFSGRDNINSSARSLHPPLPFIFQYSQKIGQNLSEMFPSASRLGDHPAYPGAHYLLGLLPTEVDTSARLVMGVLAALSHDLVHDPDFSGSIGLHVVHVDVARSTG